MFVASPGIHINPCVNINVRRLLRMQTWRDFLPTDMNLSAVFAMVIALGSSETRRNLRITMYELHPESKNQSRPV